MSRKLVSVLSLLILLSSLGTRAAFADVSLASDHVSYTVWRVNYYHGVEYSFNVNVTLEDVTDYSCSVDGVLPADATCFLNVAPYSGTLTVDYYIDRPILPDLDGSESIPLPQEGEELLGDSPPIEIPIDSVGTIAIVIHGHLLGNLTTDTGSVNPTSLEWTTWGTQDTVVSADFETVLLTMETTYIVYFTETVSIDSWEGSVNTSVAQVSGDPSVAFVVPEFPSFLILPLFMIATLLIVITYRRKHSMYC